MGRPPEHDEHTGEALLAAAERLIETHGVDYLSLRTVADDAETTTRAIYSLFGSKDGLLVALAMQAFAYLAVGLRSARETRDPVADLVEVGAGMYRSFVREHPAVFRLAFQRVAPGLPLGEEFFEARAAVWDVLEAKVKRIEDVGLLGPRTVTQAAVAFNGLCEGLGNAELRGGSLVPGDQEPVWRDAFTALIHGFATPAVKRPTRTRASAPKGRATRRPAAGRGPRKAEAD